MNRRFRFLFALAALAVLSACLNLRQERPDKRYFVLDAVRLGNPAPPSDSERVLSVRKFRVSPRFTDPGFVYRLSQYSYDSDYYNEFFVPTDGMLSEETSEWLAQTGLFAHVVDAASRMAPTHTLEGAIVNLLGDYSDDERPVALLEMQFLLLEHSGAKPGIVMQKDYRAAIALPSRAPEQLAKGLTGALTEILTELEADLKMALASNTN